jgi:hypothetical protein
MMFLSLNSRTTGVTRGTGTTNSSGAPEFIPGFSGVRVARYLVLWHTASNYPFGIIKTFSSNVVMLCQIVSSIFLDCSFLVVLFYICPK